MATGGKQRTVSLQTQNHSEEEEEKQEEEEEIGEKERRDTKYAFYEYVFRKATRDRRLDRTETSTFEDVREKLVRENELDEDGEAASVGRRLAELGDEVDSMYYDEMEEIVQMTGTPDKAYGIFVEVVKHVFEWDENTGTGNFSIGRLAALLAYAYHLCRHYIKTNANVNLIVTFTGLVATWLFRFLIKAKFYHWLNSMGGWGQLIVKGTTNWGNSLFLIIGVTSLIIWGVNYIRSR